LRDATGVAGFSLLLIQLHKPKRSMGERGVSLGAPEVLGGTATLAECGAKKVKRGGGEFEICELISNFTYIQGPLVHSLTVDMLSNNTSQKSAINKIFL